MNIELLDGKAIVVQHGDNVWLLGCPEGVGAALKEAGITPTAVLLTRVGAPGLHELEGKPLVVRATPLHIGGLEAKPIGRVHGWDYAVKSDDGSLLWTERGDVSARDVYGYSLALIGNKHRSDAFGDNIITRPWPETAQYIVSDGAWSTAEKMIKHEGDKWVIYSADGEKKLGEYDTEEEAKKRLRQIEYFKHEGKDEAAKGSTIDEPENSDTLSVKDMTMQPMDTQSQGPDIPGVPVSEPQMTVLGILDELEADFEASLPANAQGESESVRVLDADPTQGLLYIERQGGGEFAVPFTQDANGYTFAPEADWLPAHQSSNWVIDEKETKKPAEDVTVHEHSARVRDPGDFRPDSFRRKTLPKSKGGKGGVVMIIGKLKDGGDSTVVQAYRFPVDLYTPEEAHAWLKENDVKYLKFESAKTRQEAKKELPDWLPAELSMPGVAFKEQADGRMRWYAHTANDTLDLQNEVITPEALDWSLAVATVMNDRGPLLFRHLPIRLGGCDKQVRAGPLLFESGLLDQSPAAQAAMALVTRQPGVWMMSPGLRFKEDDLVNGRYRRCWIAERSLTHKPANLTTAFAVVRDKEMAMVSDDLLKEAADQLGLPFEQIKALAQKYLDTRKEFIEIDGLLNALKEGVAAEYTPPAQKDEPAPTSVPAQPAAQPDWARIIQANTAAMNSFAAVVKELAAGKLIDAQVQTAVENYMQAAPQFGSRSKSAGDGDEAVLRAALAEAEQSAGQRTMRRQPFSMTEFESIFTSQTLNR